MATQPVLDPAVLEAGRRALLAQRTSGRADDDVLLTRVRGSLVWDVDGCEYIDCTSQAWSNNLGADDPRDLEAAIEDDDLCTQSRERGLHATTRLLDMQSSHPLIGDVRCPGSMVAIEPVQDRESKAPAPAAAREIARRSVQRGVLFGDSRHTGLGDIIKVKPPLGIPHEQLDQALEVLEAVIGELEGEGVR